MDRGRNFGHPNPKAQAFRAPVAADAISPRGTREEKLTEPRTPAEHCVLAVKLVGVMNRRTCSGGQRKRLVDGLAVESWKREGVYDWNVAVDGVLLGQVGKDCGGCTPESRRSRNEFISFEQRSSSKKMI